MQKDWDNRGHTLGTNMARVAIFSVWVDIATTRDCVTAQRLEQLSCLGRELSKIASGYTRGCARRGCRVTYVAIDLGGSGEKEALKGVDDVVCLITHVVVADSGLLEIGWRVWHLAQRRD